MAVRVLLGAAIRRLEVNESISRIWIFIAVESLQVAYLVACGDGL